MKNPIRYSHEVPFCMLEVSRQFNTYEYCLPHLLDENEQYRKFFQESKAMGRYIIMDNSLHELGEAYDTARLLHWIHELKPDEFIIPDVWEDMKGSIKNAENWIDLSLPNETTKVAVVQAKNRMEAAICTKKYIELGYKKIAYSYGASYYNDICSHPNKDFGKAMGRYLILEELYRNYIIPPNIKIHLLGTAWPAEFGLYLNSKLSIDTIDTSNPIMATFDGLKYDRLGIDHKPKANMNNYQNISIQKIDKDLMEHNVRMFREINSLY